MHLFFPYEIISKFRLFISGVIDRNLILNTKTEQGEILYKNIAFMCKNQGFKLIAEGIETNKEMEIIKDSNIDIVQGFYFSKALPSSELQKYEKELEKSF